MKQSTALYNVLILIVVVLCGYLFLSDGWIFFAMLTSRPGMYGSMASYYDIPESVLMGYLFLVWVIALGIVLRLIYSGYVRRNLDEVKLTLIYFLFFAALVIVAEIFLNTRYVGKG